MFRVHGLVSIGFGLQSGVEQCRCGRARYLEQNSERKMDDFD